MSVDQQRRIAALERRGRRAAERVASDSAAPGPVDTTIPQTPAPPRVPGRRNPKWIALGVLAACLGGLLSYVIYAQVARQDSVVAMAATVYRGQVIQQSDLKSITVNGGSGLETVPSSRIPELVGHRAAFDLAVGSVVTPGSVGDVAVPALKRSIVGIKLDQGRAPNGFLFPGSTVRLVVVPPPNADAGFRDGYTDKNYPGVIVDTETGADQASLLINVDVGNDQAALLAMLSASGRLAVVRDADR